MVRVRIAQPSFRAAVAGIARLKNIHTPEQANAFLNDHYIGEFATKPAAISAVVDKARAGRC